MRRSAARARAEAMQPQDMPLQMDPAASRPVAAPLPAPKTQAQQREAEREVASALEMIPGRLYHYGAKWAPVDTDEAHFFSVRPPSAPLRPCLLPRRLGARPILRAL